MADHTATPNNATISSRAYVDMAVLDDMTSMQFNQWSYALPDTQTGCYNPGSLPIALANNDTCLLGFYCMLSKTKFQYKPRLTNLGPNSNDQHPPQMCPPTWQCAVLRANQETCPFPQGALEPLICPGGI